jgi:hypothetical protein
MKQFKDSKSRPWNVSVTVSAMERVRDLCGENISDLIQGEPPLGVRLTTEPMLFGNVLWGVLQPQAEAQGVSREELLEMEGEQYAEAFDCLMGELVGFFQKCGRKEQAIALTKQLEVLTAAANLATKRVENLNIEKLLASTFSTSATSAPESSELTPDP